jgi:hypothetical protein
MSKCLCSHIHLQHEVQQPAAGSVRRLFVLFCFGCRWRPLRYRSVPRVCVCALDASTMEQGYIVAFVHIHVVVVYAMLVVGPMLICSGSCMWLAATLRHTVQSVHMRSHLCWFQGVTFPPCRHSRVPDSLPAWGLPHFCMAWDG